MLVNSQASGMLHSSWVAEPCTAHWAQGKPYFFQYFSLLNVCQMKTNVYPDWPNAMKTLTALTQWARMRAFVKTDTPGMDWFVQVRK